MSRDDPQRTAPRAGYGTPEKAAYRGAVWDAVADECGYAPSGDILLLPSSEGVEIDVAIERGVYPARIVCVDRSGAVIATSQWRKKHPDIRFFAAEIGSVGARLSRAGVRIGFANLDLCGQVSGETVEQIRDFLATAPFDNDFFLAITVAKGREGRVLATLMKSLGYVGGGPSCARLRALCRMCGLVSDKLRRVTLCGEGSYTSGRHPMAWTVLHVDRLTDDWREGEMEEAKEVFGDVAERILGWTDEGELTRPIGEQNFTMRDAIWELLEALAGLDASFWSFPRCWRRRIFARLGAGYDLKAEDWRRILHFCRKERRTRRYPRAEAA